MPLRLLGLCRFFFAWIAKTRLFTSVLALISPTNWIPVRASRSATPFPDASSHAGRQARTARTSARSGRSFVLFSLLLLLLARWLSPLAALAHRYIAAPTLAPTRFDQAPSACLSRLASFSLVASRANNLAEISFLLSRIRLYYHFISRAAHSVRPLFEYGRRRVRTSIRAYIPAYVFLRRYARIHRPVSRQRDEQVSSCPPRRAGRRRRRRRLLATDCHSPRTVRSSVPCVVTPYTRIRRLTTDPTRAAFLLSTPLAVAHFTCNFYLAAAGCVPCRSRLRSSPHRGSRRAFEIRKTRDLFIFWLFFFCQYSGCVYLSMCVRTRGEKKYCRVSFIPEFSFLFLVRCDDVRCSAPSRRLRASMIRTAPLRVIIGLMTCIYS